MAGFVRHWEEWGVRALGRGGEGFGRVYRLCMDGDHDDWPEGEHKTKVGWRLGRAHWGRGLATEGALASVRYGFEGLGLKRIISITLPENAASRRVMEKAGLTYRGETRWRGQDVIWYAIDRDAWEPRG
jgi:RimJ/RimL family protein N-acetyltransferase